MSFQVRKKQLKKESRLNRLLEIPKEISTNEPRIVNMGFNKMLIDGKLFADMESYKKVLLCMYEYLEIKEDTIWDDYQNYKASYERELDEYEEEF